MACFEGAFGPPSHQLLRHRSQIKDWHQEIASFPSTPLKRAYENSYYFLKCSTKANQSDDVQGLCRQLVNGSNPMLESSLEWDQKPPGQLEPFIRSPTTKVLEDYKKFTYEYNQACLTCCCAYPCCDIPNISQTNIGSTFTEKSVHFDHFKAGNNVLVPTVTRMTHEREKCGDEETTSNYETKSGQQKLKIIAGITKNVKDSKQTKVDTRENVTASQRHDSARRMATRRYYDMKVSELEHFREKRKFNVFSETEAFDSQTGKRFRQKTNTFFDDQAPSRQCASSHADNMRYNHESPTEAYSERVAYPVTVSMGTTVCRLQGETGMCKSEKAFHGTKSCFCPSQEPEYLKLEGCHSQGVQGAATRHSSHEVQQSILSRTTPAETANKSHRSSEEYIRSEGNKFISLDSTKSSFLTLISNMRQQSNDVILCPYCNQTFGKYGDLKIHVQTHKILPTSANNNRTETQNSTGRFSSPRNETKTDGKVKHVVDSPGIKTPGDKTFAETIPEDKTKTRARSVIMFVGQKTNKSQSDL